MRWFNTMDEYKYITIMTQRQTCTIVAWSVKNVPGRWSEDVVGNTEDCWGWIREKFDFITTWTAGWMLVGDFVNNIHSVALLFGMSVFDNIHAKYEQQSVYLQITRWACGGGNSCRDLLNRARQKWHCLLWESRKGRSMLWHVLASSVHSVLLTVLEMAHSSL